MAHPVLPIVRLFTACDEIVLDLTDMKWQLKNPWHTVWMPPGVTKKFLLRHMQLYAQLTDGVGEGLVAVEMRSFKTNLILGRSDPEPFDFRGLGPLTVIETIFQMTDVPFPAPELYEFRILANGHHLEGGTSFLRVLPG